MKQKRLSGKGILTCGQVQYKVNYTLTIISEDAGHHHVAGRLESNEAVTIIAARAWACRLQLEDGREIAIYVRRSDKPGVAAFENSEPIREILYVEAP
jgi:hypothetical protein